MIYNPPQGFGEDPMPWVYKSAIINIHLRRN